MEETASQSLSSAENLSLPSVQVVVMNANMGCNHCRQRVSKVVSKMNGLLDYMVDLQKKEVTMRGIVDTRKSKTPQRIISNQNKKTIQGHLGLFKLMCSDSF
ncbi:hypothetical protein Cni_G12472 [Canna indica]|uniref:HMA domain-containing protein n=1 Tax=Canna indica TaxID=4628 RepID=A0AAQ3KBX6_9LILI|nr:hypothetical protein Cni_G12472 [Canna indica]